MAEAGLTVAAFVVTAGTLSIGGGSRAGADVVASSGSESLESSSTLIRRGILNFILGHFVEYFQWSSIVATPAECHKNKAHFSNIFLPTPKSQLCAKMSSLLRSSLSRRAPGRLHLVHQLKTIGKFTFLITIKVQRMFEMEFDLEM